MTNKPNKKTTTPPIDLDLWEKLFSTIVLAGIMLIFGLLIKYSVEEISFSDVLFKTGRISELMFFHMSTASFGAFFFILLLLVIKFKHLVSLNHLSKSIRSYFIFFALLNGITIGVDFYFDYNMLSWETYSLSLGAGFILAVIIHFVGKYI